MGMDVYGKKPTSKEGEYFRNNCWWWRPLWDYCVQVSPVASKVEYGQSNDGDGLDATDSLTLAADLRSMLASGEAATYANAYERHRTETPDEDCTFCGATGTRTDLGPEPRPCNACDGKGKRRPYATWYPFSVENVEEFATFLEHCGGFEIH